MQKIILWFKAMRAPFFLASLIPVLVGSVLGLRRGHFRVDFFLLSLLVVVSSHAGSNLLNDYCDAEGSDPINQNITPFSGGSRLIQQQVLRRSAYLRASVLAYAISTVAALGLSLLAQQVLILGLALAGSALGIIYNIKWSYGMGRGWGELAIGLSFGPMAVLGSFLAQTGYPAWAAVWAGLPVGLLIMGVLILNEIPDFEADRAAGKLNWVVRSGGGRPGALIYLLVVFLAYMVILASVATGILPYRILLSYLTIPLAIWILFTLYRSRMQTPGIIPALAGNIGLCALTGILMSVGLIWK
jgi:1,4-dihydroxy-2-naphthoate octaprenyltransferase